MSTSSASAGSLRIGGHPWTSQVRDTKSATQRDVVTFGNRVERDGYLQRRRVRRHIHRHRLPQLEQEVLAQVLVAIEDELRPGCDAVIAAAVDGEEIALREAAPAVLTHEDMAVVLALRLRALRRGPRHDRK